MTEPLTENSNEPILLSDQNKRSVKTVVCDLVDKLEAKEFFGEVKLNFARGKVGTMQITQHLKI